MLLNTIDSISKFSYHRRGHFQSDKQFEKFCDLVKEVFSPSCYEITADEITFKTIDMTSKDIQYILSIYKGVLNNVR